MTLHRGIKMQGQDIDKYIARFEELVQHTQYDINGPQTIDMFTRGLPTTLYKTIFQHDNPRTFEQWRTMALKRQGLWFHMNRRRNLDKFKSTPSQRTGGQQPFSHPLDTQMLWMWTEYEHDWQILKETPQQLKLNGRQIGKGGIRTDEEEGEAHQ